MMPFDESRVLELVALTMLIFGSLGAMFAFAMWRGQHLTAVVIGLTIFHEILLIGYPAWYAALNDLRFERELLTFVGSAELLQVMVGEALFCVGFSVTFLLVSGLHGSDVEAHMPFENSPLHVKAEKRTLLALVLGGLLVYGAMVVNPPPPFEEVQLALAPDAGVFVQLAGWCSAIFSFTSLMAGALLVFAKGRGTRLGRILGTIVLSSVVFVGLSSGARGRITWVLSVLFIAAVLRGSRRQIIMSAALAGIAAPAVLALGSEAHTVIIAATSLGASRMDIVRLVIEAKKEGANVTDEGPATLLAKRAEGPRNAVSLYRMHDQNGGPGPRVYIGSFLFPVPRRLWPEKLAPGSPTGDFYDAAIYQTKIITYGSDGEMGPVLASAHAYWEGGWPGVALGGILTGLLWALIARWSRRLPAQLYIIVVISFAASLLIDGFLTALCPLWSMIQTVWRWTIPLLVIYWTFLAYEGMVLRRQSMRILLRPSTS